MLDISNNTHAILIDHPVFFDSESLISDIIKDFAGGTINTFDVVRYSGSEFVIDIVRNLAQMFSYKAMGSIKIAVITNLEDAPYTSFQAMLKILEEPPANCLFLMTTANVTKLPLTVLSRVNRFTVPAAVTSATGNLIDQFFSQYSSLSKMLDDGELSELRNILEDYIKSGKTTGHSKVFEFLNRNKTSRPILTASLLFLHFLLTKSLRGAKISNPGYRGNVVLLNRIDDIWGQKEILSYHHFQYPWYAYSLLNI